jgi:hypothetical protein
MVSIVLHEDRPDIWPLVRGVFESEPGVELSHEEEWAFNSRSDLDAILLNDHLAFERYGGTLPPQPPPHVAVGVATVLNTRTPGVWPMHAPPNMPAWVVALPPIYERTLSMEDETDAMWQAILAACDRLNGSTATPTIQRLGCSLAINFWPAGKTDEERIRDLQAIQPAYQAYRVAHSST